MNIVVIVIDTLRYDYIGANGNPWIKTPNMDRLAAESWVFDRSYSASYPTIPHRTDVITGKYGSPLFPWRPLRWDHITFPGLLADAGYCTQLIHDTPHLVNGGHNFDYPFHAWTPIRGAEVDRPWIDEGDMLLPNWREDVLFDAFDLKETNPFASRLLRNYCSANRHRVNDEDWNAAKLFSTASRWLEENAKRDRFFLWIDCFDPHEPWDVPPEFAKMYVDDRNYDGSIDPRALANLNSPEMPEEGRKRAKAWYAAKVSWVDHWLGKFLDTLEETGQKQQTALLFTADHGTNDGSWGRFGKSYPVRESEAHTPFMVRMPGGGSGRSGIFVQPQDVFATIMGMAGLDMPPEIDSRNVLLQARDGKGERHLALSGVAPGSRAHNPGAFFTVFGEQSYLVFDPRPEQCQLIPYGGEANVAAENQSLVEELHAAGTAEISRRGADPKLVDWLKNHARGSLPDDCVLWDGYPGPRGFAQYFTRNYSGQ